MASISATTICAVILLIAAVLAGILINNNVLRPGQPAPEPEVRTSCTIGAPPLPAQHSAGQLGRVVVQAERERGLRRRVRQPVLIGQPADRGPGGQELGGVLPPDVVLDINRHADDAGRLSLRGFGLHPR